MVTLDKPKIAYRVDNAGNDAWTIVEVTDGAAPETITGLVSNTRYEVRVLDWGPSAYASTPFSPAALFANGEQGIWLDPSDDAVVFQETTGASATTAAGDGDPVGTILDKSGNGNHATAPTSAARPVRRKTPGGLWYLEFDGVGDCFDVPDITTSPTDLFACFGARNDWRSTDPSTLAYFFEANPATGERVVIGQMSGVSDPLRMGFVSPNIVGNFDTKAPHVASYLLDNGTGTVWGNSVQIATGTYSTAPTLADAVTFGAADTKNANFLNGRVFGGLLVARTVTPDERTQVEAYLAAKSGVPL